jgi:hypothetical protein
VLTSGALASTLLIADVVVGALSDLPRLEHEPRPEAEQAPEAPPVPAQA